MRFLNFLTIFLLCEKLCRGQNISTNLIPGAENDEVDSDSSFEVQDENVELSVILPKNYEPYQLPVTDPAQFIPVFVSIYIIDVADIDEKEELLIINANYARRWLDFKISQRITGPLRNVTLGPEALDKLWKPDLFFDGTAPVDKDTLEANHKTLRLLFNTTQFKEAQVAFSERTRMKLDCEMEFHYYPADTQVCSYTIRSFSYRQHSLKLFWEKPNSVFLRDPTHPNFDLLVESIWPDIEVNGTNKLFVEENFDPYRRGNYSALTFTVKARRKLSYHLVQTYLPSVLLIFMTWLCFLIPADMVEARIGISMTTVLTLTAMFSGIRQQAPNVSYTMAIDIWMVFCIFEVFVSLFLFTFIYWVKIRKTKEKEAIENGRMPEKTKYLNVMLDYIKAFAFPALGLSFFLFCVFYWWWLLASSDYLSWNPNSSHNGNGDEEEDPVYLRFYRYFVFDAAQLFDPSIYPPSAYKLLKNVFGLVE